MAHPRPYSRWRNFLSYFADQTLEACEGDHTDYLAVVLRKGKLLLQANGAVYSWEDHYYNFRQAFEKLDWAKLPGKETLLLGLGLGSIPQLTEELFDQVLHYTAVEYDEVVAELAEHYLLYRLKSPVETVIADAEAFVAQDYRKYDLILIDLFVDDEVPEQFNNPEFLRKLNLMLTPGGCLITNRLTFTDKDRNQTAAYWRTVFLEVFPEADFLDVKSNWMMFSDKAYLLR